MGTTGDKYSVSQYSISSILGIIDAGGMAIPEIQRPFVWRASQVRDLIDSLYYGYPTGYLIIWTNPDIRLKNGDKSEGKKILIDGQQRVTALMTAIAGRPILTEDYEEKTIKIAFNPIAEEGEEHFAVQTPIHLKTKHWVADISELFKPQFSPFNFIKAYMNDNPGIDGGKVESAISQLLAIKSCQIGIISLAHDLEIDEVTEIFVRINSQGKRLDQSDFAMSKIAADEKYGGNMLRKAIDYFCHLAVDPGFYNKLATTDKEFMGSEYEPKMRWLKDDFESIYDPDYNDMLRVSFMHIFGRGKLGDLVSLLSGRDFIDKDFKVEIIEESFNKLRSGVNNFISEYDFKQFVLAIKSAGFVSNKLLNSKMTLDFAYTLYLLLHKSNDIPKINVKRYIQKWFVLSTLTNRYTFSAESQMDRDLRNIATKGFVEFINENESAMLSEDFWNIKLVQDLETSSINSPSFNVFLASQVYGSDISFLSSGTKVADLITIAGEIHHIFPKDYLKKNGFEEKSIYNQIANYTYLDGPVNKYISNDPPELYLNSVLTSIDTGNPIFGLITNNEDFWKTLKINCIPKDILYMTVKDYPTFLQERRVKMANKIKNYYNSL